MNFTTPPPPLRVAGDDAGPRRARQHARLPVVGIMVFVGFAVFLLWANAQEGGISGTFERATEWVQERVDDVTGSARADAAVDELNSIYQVEGAYPTATGPAALDILDSNFTGMKVVRCSDHHLILSALSAGGTESHLLVTGDSWGKVDGEQSCPMDLFVPDPWLLPDQS